jgi:hypothetical protein
MISPGRNVERRAVEAADIESGRQLLHAPVGNLVQLRRGRGQRFLKHQVSVAAARDRRAVGAARTDRSTATS